MKLTKENVCVFIENEAQLHDTKQLLEKYKENIESIFIPKVFQYHKNDKPHVYFNELHNEWCFCYTLNDEDETPISFEKLEEILKESNA